MFSYEIQVKGNLWSSFVFTDKQSAENWLTDEFPKLKSQYGTLSYTINDLPGLKIGDQCNVLGDGYQVYTIIGVVKYSENRYGFLLDGWCSEEVGKCHTQYLG